MSWMQKLKRLTPAEMGLLIRIFFLEWIIRLGLWFFPFSSMRRFFEKGSNAPREGDSASSVPPWRTAQLVQAASRVIPRATCLVQALTLHHLLLKGNRPSQPHFGVRFHRQRPGGNWSP